VGLKALIRGLGVGGRKNNKRKEKAKEKVLMCEHRDKRKPHPLQGGGWGMRF
jgi:hypothetical protein